MVVYSVLSLGVAELAKFAEGASFGECLVEDDFSKLPEVPHPPQCAQMPREFPNASMLFLQKFPSEIVHCLQQKRYGSKSRISFSFDLFYELTW